MALYYELPVYKDSYQLTLKIFEITRLFNREYKYTLGQDMKRQTLELVRCIFRANRATDKLKTLEVLEDEFELLKLQVRLCVDLKIMQITKQAEIIEVMEKIGKQLSGWKKHQKNKIS